MITRVCAVLFFVMAAFVLRANALAVTEYCPAALTIAPHADRSPAPGATYAPSDIYDVQLSAETARSVSGTIALHTTAGWYDATFDSIPLREATERWRSSSAEYMRHTYESHTMRLQFPLAVSILSAFVSEAQTKGETILGWDAVGRRPCAGNADHPLSRPARDVSALVNATFVTPQPESSPLPTLVAAIASAPGSTDCEKPFAEATVVETAQVTYPSPIIGLEKPYGMTLVQVAISATGALDDAWIIGRSGNRRFDESTLDAAKASRYSPKRSFCQNVPSTYIFRAEFRP